MSKHVYNAITKTMRVCGGPVKSVDVGPCDCADGQCTVGLESRDDCLYARGGVVTAQHCNTCERIELHQDGACYICFEWRAHDQRERRTKGTDV